MMTTKRMHAMPKITRRLIANMAARDRLAAQVARHVGAFDHSAMDELQVARYGCRKLGLKVPQGHEATALSVYFSSSPSAPGRNTSRSAAMDGGDWLQKQVANLGR